MADAVAPGFAAALRADGPIDAFALCAQGIAMGDDCHMRHQATTMLLLRQTLPAMAEHAPASVLPTARMLAANGHFALTVTIAAARRRCRHPGHAGSSLVVFISRNGIDAAVQIAGLPGPLVHGARAAGRRPALPPRLLRRRRRAGHRRLGAGRVLRPGRGRQRGEPRRWRPSWAAASPTPSSAPARWATSAWRQRAPAHPDPRRRGHPARSGRPRLRRSRRRPRSSTRASSTWRDGGQIGAGIARTPVEPIRDALVALAAGRAGAGPVLLIVRPRPAWGRCGVTGGRVHGRGSGVGVAARR